MIGVYLYDIFGASAGNKSSHPSIWRNDDTGQRGNIQVIITKDYSRLGRDYLEVGRYLEFVFPVLKVRYISVNDNYDSNNFTGATGGMEVAVKNVINMMYSRDASKKVRSARTTLAKAGKFIGPQAPYGYKRSESDKQKLVIDEEPAELLSKMETFDLDLIRQAVKRITMYDDGNIQFEWNVDDFLQVKWYTLYKKAFKNYRFLIVLENKFFWSLLDTSRGGPL